MNSSTKRNRHATWIVLALGSFILAVSSSVAFSGLHKCVDEHGDVTYSGMACPEKQQERTLALGTKPQASGPGPEICARIRTLATSVADAMFDDIPPEYVIDALGGIGHVSPDFLGVINYVYSFAGVGQVTRGQIASLSYEKCIAGGFNIQDPNDTEDRKAATTGNSTGSGFIINTRGDVLTNQRVIDKCRSIHLWHDEIYYPAKLLHARAEIDLAVVNAKGLPATPATFNQASEPMRGERAIAAGYPLQNMLSRQVNITSGIVSATAGPGENPMMMQLTVPLQSGNSGGPILDAYGHVSGVSVAKISHMATLQRAGTLPENVN